MRLPVRLISCLAVTAALTSPLGAPTGASAATVVSEPSPAGARHFETDAPGWSSAVNPDGPCSVPLFCPTVVNEFVPSGGTGGAADGFLRTRATATVAVQTTVTGLWRSPTFTPAGPVDRAALTFAVRADTAALIGATGSAQLTVRLVDVADPAASVTVLSRALPVAGQFAPESATLPGGSIVPGRTYRLDLRTDFAMPAALAVSTSVDFDDIELQLTDLQPPQDLTAAVLVTDAVRVAGSVDPRGQTTEVTVAYGPTTAYGSGAGPAEVSGTGVQAFSIPLSGLTPGATYHYRVTAVNADGSTQTSDATFVVPSAPGPGPATPPAGGSDPASGSDPALDTTPPAGGAPAQRTLGSLLKSCYGGKVAITRVTVRARQARIRGLSAYAPGTPMTIRTVGGKRLGRLRAGAGGALRTAVQIPAGANPKRLRIRVHVGAVRSNAVWMKPVNAISALRGTGRTVIVRGRVDIRRVGRGVRFIARGGRGPKACRNGGGRLAVRALRVNRSTGRYSLRVRVPAGSGPVAVRTRAIGRFTAYSRFALR